MDMNRATSIVRRQEDQHRRRRGLCGRGIVGLNSTKEEKERGVSVDVGFCERRRRGGGEFFFLFFNREGPRSLPRGARNSRCLARDKRGTHEQKKSFL